MSSPKHDLKAAFLAVRRMADTLYDPYSRLEIVLILPGDVRVRLPVPITTTNQYTVLPIQNPQDMFEVCDVVRNAANDLWPKWRYGHIVIHQHDGKSLKVAIPRQDCRLPFDRKSDSDSESTWWHNEDYTLIRWCNETFHLSPMRAAIVQLLDEARHNDHPEMREEDIIEKVQAGSKRLYDIFKNQKEGQNILGRLIVRGTEEGTYRLADKPPSGDLEDSA